MKILNQGDIIELHINDVTAEGDGIGRFDALAVFVRSTLPEEKVRVRITQLRKNYAKAKLLEILVPSAARVVPPCAVYDRCGGCLLQHASYEQQLRIKDKIVADALRRIGKIDIAPQPIIGSGQQFYYRNRINYHLRCKDGKITPGFYNQQSRDFVAASCCLLPEPAIADFADKLMEFFSTTGHDLSTLREVVIRGNADQQLLLSLLSDAALPNARQIAAELMQLTPKLLSVWHNFGPAEFGIYGASWQLLAGEEFFPETIGDKELLISAASFTQVNREQAEKLYQLVKEYACLCGKETVLDIYSGIGAIALSLADSGAEIIGIESYAPAVANAKANAKKNGISNCRFLTAKAEAALPQLSASGAGVDVAVLDPPRAGCDKQVLQALAQLGAKRIIYVSCNPASLARDLRLLLDAGYAVQRVQPLDMFPQSGHVESVALLSRQEE